MVATAMTIACTMRAGSRMPGIRDAAYTAAAISAKTLTAIRMVFLMAALFMYWFSGGS